jgi:rhomboid domain-containing protein 1
MPPTTLGIVGLCCVLYAFQITADLPLNQFALCPRYVLYLREYYRIITSAVFHGSLMHIGMNMMSAAAIGAMLEKRLGTIRLLVTILWSTILTSVLYIVAALLMSGLLGNDGLMYRHSIGFSGVIFHLSVLESNLGPHRSRSVFGAISVPAHLYPWVL